MKVIFENSGVTSPEVSIILPGGNSPEELYSLYYLNNQKVLREKYEIIYIGYYSEYSLEYIEKLKEYESLSKHPVIDKWIVMEISDDMYYHKHLIYNTGIIASKGKVITFFKPGLIVDSTFVESVIELFSEDNNIVLHMNERWNIDDQLHPFDYPSIEEIKNKCCMSLKDGKINDLFNRRKYINIGGYDICMCALRGDLIDIGGSDEHQNYMGNAGGPYEMALRLVNFGKREVRHSKEVVYYLQLPGLDRITNDLSYCDDYIASKIILDIKESSRVLPIVENTSIETLRRDTGTVIYDSLLLQSVPMMELSSWKPFAAKYNSKRSIDWCVSLCRRIKNDPKIFFRYFITGIPLYYVIFSLILRQIYGKLANRAPNQKEIMKKNIFFGVKLFFLFFFRMLKNNVYTVKLCRNTLKKLRYRETREIAIYGANFVTKILCIIAKQMSLRVTGIYDKSCFGNKLLRYKILPSQSLAGFEGKVVVATLAKNIESVSELKDLGISRDNIIKLR